MHQSSSPVSEAQSALNAAADAGFRIEQLTQAVNSGRLGPAELIDVTTERQALLIQVQPQRRQ